MRDKIPLMKYCFIFLLLSYNLTNAQNIGIGTTTPGYKLDVNGTLRSTGNAYFDNRVNIGSVPGNNYYTFQVNDGQMAIYNTADNKHWYFSYNSGYNQFSLVEATNGTGTLRVVVNNGGNMGVGTFEPSSKLHVNGDVKVSDGEFILTEGVGNTSVNKGFVQLNGDDLRIGTYSSNDNGKFIVRVDGGDHFSVNGEGDASLSGDLTVKGNKGVLYNAASAANLRYYTREAAFSVTGLQPQTLSGETTIAFDGGFTNPPVVIVGDIVSNGGTAGQLYALELKVYAVTANSCKVRLMNTGNIPVTQSITWNIVCVGN